MSLDRAVIFAGPSLNGANLEFGPAFESRPPAKRGDVYRIALEEPRAILLIDGVFEDITRRLPQRDSLGANAGNSRFRSCEPRGAASRGTR